MEAEDNNKFLLTRIHETYTLLNTTEPDYNPSDQLIIDNFLQTLAQIALSIAARKKANEQTGN